VLRLRLIAPKHPLIRIEEGKTKKHDPIPTLLELVRDGAVMPSHTVQGFWRFLGFELPEPSINIKYVETALTTGMLQHQESFFGKTHYTPLPVNEVPLMMLLDRLQAPGSILNTRDLLRLRLICASQITCFAWPKLQRFAPPNTRCSARAKRQAKKKKLKCLGKCRFIVLLCSFLSCNGQTSLEVGLALLSYTPRLGVRASVLAPADGKSIADYLL